MLSLTLKLFLGRCVFDWTFLYHTLSTKGENKVLCEGESFLVCTSNYLIRVSVLSLFLVMTRHMWEFINISIEKSFIMFGQTRQTFPAERITLKMVILSHEWLSGAQKLVTCEYKEVFIIIDHKMISEELILLRGLHIIMSELVLTLTFFVCFYQMLY